MAVKFTADQQRVIDLRNCNILVSAAAGSGKTAVLVERIVQLVSDPDSQTDIDQLLVVTFTKAAAAQMRERLTKVLSQKAEAEPENEHLQRQLTLIHNAQITTIDSFCLYLIRNHFNDIGLDPDFRTADEGEMQLLCRDVLAELLEEKFSQKDPDFLHCVECFVPGGSEKRLEELILQLYEFSMSYPWPEEWLESHRTDYDFGSLEELESSAWFGSLQEKTALILEECRRQTAENLELCARADGPYMYVPALEADLSLTEELSGMAGDFQKLYERLSGLSFARLGAKKDNSVSEEKKELVKKNRERVKGMLTGMKEKYFFAPPDTWLAEMQKAAPALHVLVDLTLLFKQRLDEKKREKNLLDFSDMEHMALRILQKKESDGSYTATKTAREYQKQFREILIDEYQDSNLVQELLLQSISGEEEGRYDRFMVGDVKQSIYKFRLARPEIFMEKFDTYQKADGDCVRVDLKQNFRSRREVTDCVNDVFGQIMHRRLGGVEYDSDAALYPAAEFPQPAGAPHSLYEPEFLVAAGDEGGESDKRREAYLVADRIRRLVGSLPVRDKETGSLRPASYKDIVILLRTTAGWDEEFKKVLEEAQIPVHVTSKTGYFAATEVQNVLNFLRILNNPRKDIALFGVLHSCIGGFSDAEIAQLRAADESRKRKLYDCLKLAAETAHENGAETAAAAAEGSTGADKEGRSETAADKENGSETAAGLGGKLARKCVSFLSFLNRFRQYAVYLPIHSLIERFLEETGYLYTVSAMPGGSQRKINVEMLLTRAENFEKTSYSGLFHFIRYIEQMEKYNVDYGEGGAMDENADVVRIMSIHKSKGLEFPVCFVSGLSKRFNRQDAARPVIMDMDLGLATDCVDPVARTKRTTLKKNVLAQKLLEDSLGEELRVLYVAMTRAEEKLILTACCKEEKAPQTDGNAPAAASYARLAEASGFFDILLPAWQAAGRKVIYRTGADYLQGELAQQAAAHNEKQRLTLSDPEPFLKTEECKEILERLNSVYAHENLADLFVKTTVSELKKAGMQEGEEPGKEMFPEEEIVPYLPQFVRSKEKNVTGTLRGSAYHRLLELFPFERKENAALWTIAEIKAVIEEKKESQELSAEYAEVINPHKIAAFLRTQLAGRMSRAHQNHGLKREQPFVLGISASRLKEELPEEETVLIQGIIDVFFEEDGKLVVADYKTDAVKEEEELVRRYRVQLDYYAQALERLTGKAVKEKIIYSFALEKEIVL